MQLWLNDPMNLERLKQGGGGLGGFSPADQLLAGKRRFGLDSSSDRSSPLEKMDDDSGSNQGTYLSIYLSI